MEPHEKRIQGYKKRQVELRQQVGRLKAGRLKSGGEAQTAAVIQRTERQISDLERVIVRLGERGTA
jgi:hypothetical protein